MSPNLERLIRLQQLDTTIEEARRTIAAHPERLAGQDALLQDATGAVDTRAQQLKDNHDRRRALEKEAAIFQGRLTKFKDQLSAVKTNREYQAMQHEIATAQNDLGTVEEKVLECMMEADTIGADLKLAESALATTKAQVDAAKTRFGDELAVVDASLKTATEARAVLVTTLDPALIALFEHVARARKGVAISSATRDGLCSVCHVRLRPPVFQQVRQNDNIVQCESCQRILYYVPPPPPVEPPVTHPA